MPHEDVYQVFLVVHKVAVPDHDHNNKQHPMKKLEMEDHDQSQSKQPKDILI
jgi:hypothetical protein